MKVQQYSMQRKDLLIFLSILICAPLMHAQSLQEEALELFKQKAFDYATASISVKSVTGKELVYVNADQRLIPASSLKLITTFTALSEFGKDYRFRTKVGYQGKIKRDGTLDGNLVIIASGDPSLGSSRFGKEYSLDAVLSKIHRAVKDAGITCVDGVIEIRTNVYSGQAIGDTWPYADIANYYGGGAWSLNFNENEYKLSFRPNTPEGQTAQVYKIEPPIPYITFRSEVETLGPRTGDNAYIYGDPYNYQKIVRGSIPFSNKPFTIRGAIPDPPSSFARVLGSYLEEKKISTRGIFLNNKPIKKSLFTEILVLESPILSDIIQQANYESINLYCESLLRLLGKKHKQEGSLDKGIEYVEEHLAELGIEKYAFNINDGSGLSPRNMITTDAFTDFLNYTFQKYGEEVLEYLPQTGVSGTVQNMMNTKSGQKQIWLKSGSMGGVLSYTGFIKSKTKKWYSVSIISNNHAHGNYKVKLEIEKMLEKLWKTL